MHALMYVITAHPPTASVEALEQSVRMQSMVEMIQFIPCLELLPHVMPRNKLLMRNVRMRDEHAARQLAEHKRTLNVEHPRDFIDAYLIAMHEKQRLGQPTTFDGACDRCLQQVVLWADSIHACLGCCDP